MHVSDLILCILSAPYGVREPTKKQGRSPKSTSPNRLSSQEHFQFERNEDNSSRNSTSQYESAKDTLPIHSELKLTNQNKGEPPSLNQDIDFLVSTNQNQRMLVSSNPNQEMIASTNHNNEVPALTNQNIEVAASTNQNQKISDSANQSQEVPNSANQTQNSFAVQIQYHISEV
jgi:hypothetical protein